MVNIDFKKFHEYELISEAFFRESDLYNQVYVRESVKNTPEEKYIRDLHVNRLSLLFEKMNEAKSLCVKSYQGNLIKYIDMKSELEKDFRTAASQENMLLISILLDSQVGLAVLNPEVDIFLLNFFTDFFKKEEEENSYDFFVKNLFEQVLDTAEYGMVEYTEILNKVFSLGKSTWYDGFNQQIQKLIGCAPISKDTFMAVKKGLLIPSEFKDMSEDIVSYIDNVYVKQGLVDKDYNWI